MQAAIEMFMLQRDPRQPAGYEGRISNVCVPRLIQPMDLRLPYSPSDNQILGVGLESQIEPWLASTAPSTKA